MENFGGIQEPAGTERADRTFRFFDQNRRELDEQERNQGDRFSKFQQRLNKTGFRFGIKDPDKTNLL